MPAEPLDVVKRLSALSSPARRDLWTFLEISAAIPGQGILDEERYFESLLKLRPPRDGPGSD